MEQDIRRLIGEKIRYYRKARGYTLTAFAGILHRSKSAISKYERGEVSIDINTLHEIAAALEVPLFQLIDDGSMAAAPVLFPPTEQPPEKPQLFYCYMWGGHDKAYLSKHVLLLGETTSALYSEIESEAHYQRCKYFYTGEVRRTETFCRVFLVNTIHRDDLAIVEFQRPLSSDSLLFGFLASFSIGVNFPIATRILLSSHRITDEDRLRTLLPFSKEDWKSYKLRNAFFVPHRNTVTDANRSDEQ